MKQRQQRGQRWELSSGICGSISPTEVRPRCGDQEAAAIWQHEHELQTAVALDPTEDLECPAVERVARTNEGGLLGAAIVMVMGIVTCLPSIE